jgi:hypothetical protein
MIKTRVLEMTYGSKSIFTPQRFQEKSQFFFGVLSLKGGWVSIGELSFQAYSDSQRKECLGLCKKIIDDFMIEEGEGVLYEHCYNGADND